MAPNNAARLNAIPAEIVQINHQLAAEFQPPLNAAPVPPVNWERVHVLQARRVALERERAALVRER